MAAPELSSPLFAILAALIEEKVGLHYSLQDRDLLERKVTARALETGFESLLDYYYYLRYDPRGEEELSELVETLVVGETYFFREWQPMRVLVDAFLEPWCAAGRRPRIWSAACASGEEPLSLAMLLDARGLLDRVDLVATDVSARAIASARGGHFRKRSVRQTVDPELVERYLRPDDGGYVVTSRLIEAIHWDQINLVHEGAIARLGRLDAILCRNVLIYFSDQTVRWVLDRMGRALGDDGVLLVGVTESLLRYGGAFRGEEHGGVFLYRKGAAS